MCNGMIISKCLYRSIMSDFHTFEPFIDVKFTDDEGLSRRNEDDADVSLIFTERNATDRQRNIIIIKKKREKKKRKKSTRWIRLNSSVNNGMKRTFRGKTSRCLMMF